MLGTGGFFWICSNYSRPCTNIPVSCLIVPFPVKQEGPVIIQDLHIPRPVLQGCLFGVGAVAAAATQASVGDEMKAKQGVKYDGRVDVVLSRQQ